MAQVLAGKFKQTGLAKKEKVALGQQSEQLAKMPVPLLPKGTEPSVQITRSWDEKESRWARERGSGNTGRKGWTPQ